MDGASKVSAAGPSRLNLELARFAFPTGDDGLPDNGAGDDAGTRDEPNPGREADGPAGESGGATTPDTFGLPSWTDALVRGLGEVGVTLAFVVLALGLIYFGVTQALDVKPLRAAADIAL